MRYLILIISLTGGLVSFNSYAKSSCPAIQVPFQFDLFLAHYVPSNPSHPEYGSIPALDINRCTYAITTFTCPEDADPSRSGTFCTATSMVLLSDDGDTNAPVIDPDTDKPDTKPDDSDTPPTEPDKPVEPEFPEYSRPPPVEDMSYVNNQLAYINSHTPDEIYEGYDLVYDFTRSWSDNGAVFRALLRKLSGFYPPTYSSADHYNAFVKTWANAYWRMVPSPPGVPEHCQHGFLLPEDCVVYKSRIDAYYRYVSPGTSISTETIGSIRGVNDPNYYSYSDYKAGYTRCQINPHDSSCNKPDYSDSGGDNNPDGNDNNPEDGNTNTDNPGTGGGSGSGSTSCPAGSFNVPGEGCQHLFCSEGYHLVPGPTPSDFPSCVKDSSSSSGGTSVTPGNGHVDSGDGDNGDVVAAINAFHSDNNKNHKELMDDLNKKPVPPDYTGMEGEFSSVVGGAVNGITDSVKSAWDAGKTAFGEGLSGIDSMLPDIKTSFDLPPGFEAASLGRCIPIVLDFDIKLIGIPDYHFHAVGTQVCLLYDKYIRPVLNFVMVMLSFFVIHRLLIRSAEFLTDGRN